MSKQVGGLPLLITLLGLFSICAVRSEAAQTQPTPAPPDILTVQGLGDATAPLGGLWQFHLGDDPTFAAPVLNDSAWEKLRVDQTWGYQTHPGYTGFAWYRRHIDIAPVPGAAPDLALYLPRIDDAYEVYWNGRLVGTRGKLPPHAVFYYIPPPFTVGLGSVRSGVLAIRVWKAPFQSFDSTDLGGIARPPLAGSPAAIAAFKASLDYRFLRNHTYHFALQLLFVIVAILSFLTWLRNRNVRVLLWTALYCSVDPTLYILLSLRLPLPFNFSIGLSQPFFSLADISTWFLLLYLLNLTGNAHIVRWTRILAILSITATSLDGVISFFDWGGPHAVLLQISDAAFTFTFTTIQLWAIVLVLRAIGKRLTLSRWLVAIFAFLHEMLNVIRIGAEQGQRYTHWTFGDNLSTALFTINGNAFSVDAIITAGFFLSLLYAIYVYFLEESRRQSAIAAEFKSAQELQRVLIPETLPQLPGFDVTSAYRPAQEVGGDFFQVIAKPSGTALIILGDVSGKGLKAAMTVSLIIGAVRTLTDIYDDPAEILSGLNRRLSGRLHNGFVTCLILRLDTDGLCTLANAGHLAPFLNAAELTLPPALPLGLVPSASYETTTLRLAIDDRLTLYTDGLLEARTPTGELYGFDRVQSLLATRPAASTAVAAAVAFGQDDDITILTLTRLALGVESTSSLHAPTLVTVAA
jgi:hypothetical protein